MSDISIELQKGLVDTSIPSSLMRTSLNMQNALTAFPKCILDGSESESRYTRILYPSGVLKGNATICLLEKERMKRK